MSGQTLLITSRGVCCTRSSAAGFLSHCQVSSLTDIHGLWSTSSSSLQNSHPLTSSKKALLRISAKWRSLPFLQLYFTLRLYLCRLRNIRCRHFGAVANGLVKIGSSGLWSVSMWTKSRPYTYTATRKDNR